jgi:hypothetical protein
VPQDGVDVAENSKLATSTNRSDNQLQVSQSSFTILIRLLVFCGCLVQSRMAPNQPSLICRTSDVFSARDRLHVKFSCPVVLSSPYVCLSDLLFVEAPKA